MSQPNRLYSLQVFRGIAAMLVVLYHASVYSQEQLGFSFLGGAFLFGHTGVDFFFVLSGFIIYYIHRADIGLPSRFRPYLKKRVLRVIPVYWIVTSIKLALIVAIPTLAKSYERDPLNLISSYLLLPQRNLPLIGAAWTLTYEALFYLFFATLLMIAVAVSAACLFYLAVERPLLRLLSQRRPPVPQPAPVVAAPP